MKLSSFSSMNKTKTCKVNSKIMPVQARKKLFAKISLIHIRSVSKYPFGQLPWALAEPMETLKNTSGQGCSRNWRVQLNQWKE